MAECIGELAERQEREDPVEPADVTVATLPQEHHPAEVATLRRAITVHVGSDGRGRPRETVRCEKGTKFATDEPLVSAIPHAFENGRKP